MRKYFFSGKFFEVIPENTKRKFFLYVGLLIFASILELFGLSLIIPIISKVLNPEQDLSIFEGNIFFNELLASLEILFIIFIIFILLKNFLLIFINSNFYKFIFKSEEEISNKMLSNYLKHNYSFFVNENSSKLINNLTFEILKINDSVIHFVSVISEAFFLSGLIIVFLFINAQATISILLLLLLFCFLYIYIFKSKLVEIGGELININSKRLKSLNEIFINIRATKVLGKENFFYEKYKILYSRSINLRILNSIIKLLPRFFVEIFVILIFVIGYFFLLFKNIGITDKIPEIGFLVICMLRIIPSINKIITSIQILNFTEKTFENLDKIINQYYKKDYSVSKNDFKEIVVKEKIKDIEFSNINFHYGDKKILNNTNIKFETNKIYGIFGGSGNGKSTFLNLLLGLYEFENTEISINKKKIKTENKFSLKLSERIGIVSQNQSVLDDTINRNIAFGIKDSDINEKLIKEVTKKTGLSEFIENLNYKYQTNIGEWGSKISGGQVQRLLISRALYNDPDILILDEPTSSLDRKLEKEIIEMINNIKLNKIVIFVTHNEENKNFFDNSYKLENGKFSEI